MRQSIDICTATYSTIDHLSRLRPLCHGSGGPCKKKEKKQQHNNDDQQQSTLRHGRRKKKKRVSELMQQQRWSDYRIFTPPAPAHTNDKLLSLSPAHTCAQFLSIEYLERHLRWRNKNKTFKRRRSVFLTARNCLVTFKGRTRTYWKESTKKKKPNSGRHSEWTFRRVDGIECSKGLARALYWSNFVSLK